MSGRGAKSGTGEERERGEKSGKGAMSATGVDNRSCDKSLALAFIPPFVARFPLVPREPRHALSSEACA
jgi:hypothetical protein